MKSFQVVGHVLIVCVSLLHGFRPVNSVPIFIIIPSIFFFYFYFFPVPQQESKKERKERKEKGMEWKPFIWGNLFSLNLLCVSVCLFFFKTTSSSTGHNFSSLQLYCNFPFKPNFSFTPPPHSISLSLLVRIPIKPTNPLPSPNPGLNHNLSIIPNPFPSPFPPSSPLSSSSSSYFLINQSEINE